MTQVTRFEAFRENIIQLRRKRIDMADAGGARGHALFRILLELEEIEIVASIFHFAGAFEGGGGAGKNSEAGRQREGLLCAGQKHVDPKLVKRYFRRAQGAHGIDNKHYVRIFLLELRDIVERAHDAGRSLVVDESEGIELAAGQPGVDLFGANGRAPLDLQCFRAFAAALGHVQPLIRKRAAHAAEHFFRDQIADRSLHHSPSGRGAQVNETIGIKKLLKLRLNFRVQILKALAAVTDHGRAKGLKVFLVYLDRSRNVHFYISQKSM